MPKSKKPMTFEATGSGREKSPISEMSTERKREVVAQLTDDVLAKLTAAFFEVVSGEKWGKRDLALISGINETAIGHILAGRRKNLTVETIALLARAMEKRPELVLHDTRPKGNSLGRSSSAADTPASAQSVTMSSRSLLTDQRSSAANASPAGLLQQRLQKASATNFSEISVQAEFNQNSG
jgi:hypothetical protein